MSQAVGASRRSRLQPFAWSAYQGSCWNDTSEEIGGPCAGAEPSDGGIWHTLESTVEEPQAFNDTVEPAVVDNGRRWSGINSEPWVSRRVRTVVHGRERLPPLIGGHRGPARVVGGASRFADVHG